MTQTAYDILVDMKDKRTKRERKIIPFEFADHIFLNRNGNLLQNSNYNRYLEQICIKAGIREDINAYIASYIRYMVY